MPAAPSREPEAERRRSPAGPGTRRTPPPSASCRLLPARLGQRPRPGAPSLAKGRFDQKEQEAYSQRELVALLIGAHRTPRQGPLIHACDFLVHPVQLKTFGGGAEV